MPLRAALSATAAPEGPADGAGDRDGCWDAGALLTVRGAGLLERMLSGVGVEPAAPKVGVVPVVVPGVVVGVVIGAEEAGAGATGVMGVNGVGEGEDVTNERGCIGVKLGSVVEGVDDCGGRGDG